MGRTSSTHTVDTSATGKQFAGDRSEQDFLLFYSLETGKTKLSEAVHALYYLPTNYKLVVIGDQSGRMMPWAEKAIMSRITFENQTELSVQETTTPFSYTSAIIAGHDDQSVFEKALAPHVTISDSTDDIVSDDNHGFRVAIGNPEALATAVLRIARMAHIPEVGAVMAA